MGLWPEFCRVTVVTHNCGGKYIVGLMAKHTLLNWLMLMLILTLMLILILTLMLMLMLVLVLWSMGFIRAWPIALQWAK